MAIFSHPSDSHEQRANQYVLLILDAQRIKSFVPNIRSRFDQMLCCHDYPRDGSIISTILIRDLITDSLGYFSTVLYLSINRTCSMSYPF
jgi:hypothetical protein